MTPEKAYEYALKNGPSEETRKIACKDPKFAYWYAEDVDKCPGENTRNAACKNPYYAYHYARDVDQCPREDTRKVACEDPECAYYYAKDIDKDFHEDTWNAVQNTEYEEEYKEFFNSIMKEEII